MVSRRKLAHKLFVTAGGGIALVVLILMILSAAFAPMVAPHDPSEQDISRRFIPPLLMPDGGWENPLGTDQLGRDILSRLLYGGRVSFTISFVASAISAFVGISLGLFAGYRGKLIDVAVMRFADAQQAFPFTVIAIAAIAVLQPSVTAIIAILALWGWVPHARIMRGDVLSMRAQEFVQAARAIGGTELRIIIVHILPNALSNQIVIWTFTIAQFIIIESGLSFLGLGVPPSVPSWGSMLADGRTFLDRAWWLSTFPGLAVMLTVLAINLIGDMLRDLFDPRI